MPFFASFLVALLVSVTISIIAYLILPKPKQPKPDSARDFENPTAEAGREIPKIFGTVIVKGLNVLDFGDKQIVTYEVDA